MDYDIPEFYKYLTWYELNTPMDIYNFMQEMKDDGVNISDYPDIETYYNILIEHALKKDDADMIVVEYVIHKLRNALIRYGFAHSTYLMKRKTNKNLYFYWHERKE